MDRFAAARAMATALRRRIAVRVFGANFAPAAAIALFAGGAAVLAGRLWAPGWQNHILIWVPTVLTAAAFAFAFFRAWRRTPSFDKLLVYIDSISPGGGLLGCVSERDAVAWAEAITLPLPPSVSTRHVAVPLAALLAGMAFLAGAAMIPVNRDNPCSPPRMLDISREKELLSEQIELLESEEILPPEKAEKMRNELDRLASDNRAEDAASVYEQLDSMNRQLSDSAAEAVRKLTAAIGEAEAGRSFAEAALKIPEEFKISPDINKELADLAGKFGGSNPDLAEELAACCKNGSIDAKTLEKLAKACKGKAEKLCAKLKKLSKEGRGGKCPGGGEEELLKFLAEAKCSGTLSGMLTQCGGPGCGAPTRGRGDANLNFSNNASAASSFGKDISLDADEDESIVVSQRASAPEEDVEEERKEAVAGNLQTAVSGRERRGESVNPSHRRTVDWYMNKISDKEQ
ncbi:MAG: hypothetical protein AB7F40_07155 [Victivallaceae bacterium]|nr:hypothetical protein [Victivallaceae bacterium]